MSAIQALADQLLDRGRLTGYEAALLLEKIWEGPLPEKVKPANKHAAGLNAESLVNTIAAADRLFRIALEILHNYNPQNDDEEKFIEKAVGQTLKSALFQVDEGTDKLNLTVEELNVRGHCLQPARVEEI